MIAFSPFVPGVDEDQVPIWRRRRITLDHGMQQMPRAAQACFRAEETHPTVGVGCCPKRALYRENARRMGLAQPKNRASPDRSKRWPGVLFAGGSVWPAASRLFPAVSATLPCPAETPLRRQSPNRQAVYGRRQNSPLYTGRVRPDQLNALPRAKYSAVCLDRVGCLCGRQEKAVCHQCGCSVRLRKTDNSQRMWTRSSATE